MQNVYEILNERGFVKQLSHPELIDELSEKQITFYIGFDPTADSLHIGHFLQLMAMAHMQKAGHTPIALIGGGTAVVGDPSGRTDMRQMLTLEQINENANKFKIQMAKFLDFSDGKALMLNNADWLLKLNYLEFLRDIGVHFSVNKMLTAECFKKRLETGLSFFEFNYMLMQSYDFLYLNRNHNCTLEMGGDDQWSNILAGADLIRRKESTPAYALTFALLTKSDGTKMGKTAGGAIWLDENKTSCYDFYQYWRNINDDDVIKCLKLLTFLPLSEIQKYEKMTGAELNEAKALLAFEVTKQVHSEEKAKEAQIAAKALFSQGTNFDTVPSSELQKDILVVDALAESSLAKSKSDARRLIESGSVYIEDIKVESIESKVKDFVKDNQEWVILKKGKKTYHKIIFTK